MQIQLGLAVAAVAIVLTISTARAELDGVLRAAQAWGELPPPAATSVMRNAAAPAPDPTQAAGTAASQAPLSDWVREPAANFVEAMSRLVELGGAIVYNNRHTVAGGAVGCAAGALAGVATVAAAAYVTAGVTLAMTGDGAWIGCGIGAVLGAMTAWPIDHVFDKQ